jgi:hypothetical protein
MTMNKSLSDFQPIVGVHAEQRRGAICSKAYAGLQRFTGCLVMGEIGFGRVSANRRQVMQLL